MLVIKVLRFESQEYKYTGSLAGVATIQTGSISEGYHLIIHWKMSWPYSRYRKTCTRQYIKLAHHIDDDIRPSLIYSDTNSNTTPSNVISACTLLLVNTMHVLSFRISLSASIRRSFNKQMPPRPLTSSTYIEKLSNFSRKCLF